KLRTHFIGKLGETAANKLLINNQFTTKPLFQDISEERRCDIEISLNAGNKTKVDIKTWSKKYWDKLGRCIAVSQLESIKEKCDIIMWCVLEDDIEEAPKLGQCGTYTANVGSWSTIEDIENAPQKLTGIPGRRSVY